MTRLCEYRDITPETRSNLTELDSAASARLQGRTVQLVHATAGWEPAGSMARWTDGFYAVWFEMNGARNGQRYRTEPEARTHFARLTEES
jgi:hypothetical protein